MFFYSGGLLELFINELGFFYFVAEIANFAFLTLILIVFTHYKIIEREYFLFWMIYFYLELESINHHYLENY